MIDTITQDGIVHWTCAGEECKAQLSAHVSELEYISPSDGPGGAVIALPICECGTRCFLKADYSLNDLFKLTLTVVDGMGNIKGYALPLRHVKNLLAHHALYRIGRAAHAPVVPLPGGESLEMVGNLAIDTIYSLWFAWATLRGRGQMIAGFNQFLLELAGPKEVVNSGLICNPS